jgi:hypothetical protein
MPLRKGVLRRSNTRKVNVFYSSLSEGGGDEEKVGKRIYCPWYVQSVFFGLGEGRL